MPKTKKRRRSPKTVLRIPDLAHSKSAVLNSLGSESSHRTYDYAIDKFVDWYCSEPRWHSIARSSWDIGSILSSSVTRHPPSISTWPRFTGSRSKPPTLGCLALNLPLESRV